MAAWRWSIRFQRLERGHEVNTPWSDAAKRRLLSVKGEPLVFAEWYRVMFLHYEVEPSVVCAQLPPPFGLELYQCKAIVSLVALTMRRFRANPGAPFWAQIFAAVSEQRFLNLRTYVRHDDEPGAFFFWSWLSRPWGLPLPRGPLGLTCDFAESEYHHEHEKGGLWGVVRGRANCGRFAYRGHIKPDQSFGSCIAGSLAEFALERFSGYFWHRGAGRVFRAWHPAWLQAPIEIEIEDDNLAVCAFPWFAGARFIEAHYAPGFDEVWIGRPHRLPAPASRRRDHCQRQSEFLEAR
jgi:uncharacterized protein YqjF (DUF2071 family)